MKGLKVTITAALPPGRFGALEIAEDKVLRFKEKPKGDGAMINAGFFVLHPSVMTLIVNDATVWGQEPLETLASQGQSAVFQHKGFWLPMHTLRDKLHLEELWSTKNAPWKVW